MSKLPIIPSNNSDGFLVYPKIPIPSSASTSDSQKSMLHDYPPFFNHYNYNTFNQNNKLAPFAFESKLNEFESKMIALENTNINLMHRLEESERKFERQLQLMQSKADEERESRYKTDKAITGVSDNYNSSIHDMRIRLNTIQDMIANDEKWKVDQRNREMDIYKSLINKVTDKVGAIVKLEVDARYKSDTENKQMVNGLNTRFENEIEAMRRDMDEFMTVMRQEINRSFKECGERADNVTKYFEKQIANAMFNNESENMKGFILKLTDQFKTNLTAQGTKDELMEERLKKMEYCIPQMKESFYEFISTVEERLVNKLRDIKIFSEINIRKSNEGLSSQIADIAKSTDDSIQMLSNQLMDTRNRINLTLEDIGRNSKAQLFAICEDLTSLANRVYLYENILKDHEEQYDDIKLKIENEVNSIRVQYDVQSINERIIRAIENEEIKDAIRDCVKALGNVNSNFAENITEMNKSSEMNIMGLVERTQILQDMINKIVEKNYTMFEDVQKNFDKIETKQMLNECLFKIEDDYIIEQLENNRLFQIDTKNQIDSLSSTMNSSGSNMTEMMNEIKAAAKENEVKGAITRTIEHMLMDVDSKAKDQYNTYQSNQNEAGLLNALTALDNRVQDHINDNESEFKIVKELIGTKGKSNASSESEIKCSLQQAINKAEFDNIYSHINKLSTQTSTIPSGGSKGMPGESNPFNDTINDAIDSKINNALERIKNENVNMWVNAVELTQKVNQLEEIKKIITDIPPVIVPINESMKRIMDLNFDFDDNPHPVISPDQDQESRDNQSNQVQMNDIEYENNNEK